MTRIVLLLGLSAWLTSTSVCAQVLSTSPSVPNSMYRTPSRTPIQLPPPYPPSAQAPVAPLAPPPPRMRTAPTITRQPVPTATQQFSAPLPAHLRPRFQRRPSLWDRRKPSKTFLFYDVQARQVGDLLTLLIMEATDVDNSETRALDKESEDSGLLNLTTATGGDLGTSSANLEGQGRGSASRGFDGSATFSSARQFNDRITVTVMDVLPNGNLRIAGRRKLTVAGDSRTLCVSGVVRPVDIRADNSVTSRLVGGLEVTYEGVGVESHFTKQGWLSKSFNKVWPF